MRELSLHILDIVQNSISALAKNIYIEICEDLPLNKYQILIKDDGTGMDEETLNRVNNTFVSSRITRKVGMGIAIFRAAAEISGGGLKIDSEPGKGTIVNAVFQHDNIDRMPLGDIAETLLILIMKAKDIDFIYRHIYINKEQTRKEYNFSTIEIKALIEDIPIDSYEILQFIKKDINENLSEMGVI